MSTLDHRGLGPILGVLYPDGHAPNVVEIPVTITVLLPRCSECRTPMHPAQNARRTSLGWMCMTCYERGVLSHYSTVTVATLPPISRWRRLLAWFIKPPLPVARVRER